MSVERARGAEQGALLAMVLATLLWGGTFVAIRDIVHDLAPAALVCARFSVASLICAVLLAARRRWPSRAAWGAGALGGVLLVASFTLQAVGLLDTSAGTSAFLTCAGTLAAAFWAWLLLRQRPGGVLLTGIGVALVGAALLSLDRTLSIGRGELVTIVGALVFPLQIVVVARFGHRVEPLELAAVQALTIAVLLVPFSGDLPTALRGLGSDGWLRFAYLAVAGSTIAPLLQIWAQRSLPPGRIALLFALEPVFALVVALTLGGERFVPRWWLGAALILSAVVFVESRSAAEASRSRPATA
ncbi:MAG: DMT family transporter [Candidatus Eisenbacteria bacterium]|uniref:DMT family transporter n=1 Tax=Eiseniibacteriota bacterium TaxID=2212470 RepID=A0A849SJ32_UNCEI|nr:DMT family transporter [Candidatus Eisenbacteria bacterium]